MKPSQGFEEIPHAADWSLHVWADDLPSLFAEAARGMNALAGVQLAPGPRLRRTYEHRAPDAESLLVAFLSEMVFQQEHENTAFDRYQLELEGAHLSVQVDGAPIASMDKPIKAVTFHNLQINRTARGYEVVIVFDV